jgi:hypothetical protein
MLSICLLILAQANPTVVRLAVNGLPDGPLPAIEVTLPSGQKTAVKTPGEFSASMPGSYRVSGEPFRLAGQLIDTVYEAAPQQQVVKPGTSVTLQLSYRVRPGSGMLWAATARIEDEDDFTKGTLRALTEENLLAGGFTAPARQLIAGPRLAGGIAGPDGSFYFVDGWNVSSWMRATPAALATTSGKAAPVAGAPAHAYAISPAGDIWTLHDGVVRRLAKGSMRPGAADVELTLEELPDGHILFNAAGDLLLYGREQVARIVGAKLNGKRTLTRADAAAFVTFSSGSLGHGAVDAAGNLWVPDENSEVIAISAAQLTGAAAIEPRRFEVPLSASALTVDNAGGVWVLIRYTGELFHLPAGGAAFSRKGQFGHGFDEHTQLTLNPPPVWSPLAKAAAFPKRLEP